MKCNMVYLYALKSHLLFFGTKTLEKKQFSFEEEKAMSVCVCVCVRVCDGKEGEAIAIIVFKECPSLVFITIELCVMAEFNNVDIYWW